MLTAPGEGGLSAQKRKRSEEEASEIAGWPQGRAIPAGEPLTVGVEGTREGSHVVRAGPFIVRILIAACVLSDPERGCKAQALQRKGSR